MKYLVLIIALMISMAVYAGEECGLYFDNQRGFLEIKDIKIESSSEIIPLVMFEQTSDGTFKVIAIIDSNNVKHIIE